MNYIYKTIKLQSQPAPAVCLSYRAPKIFLLRDSSKLQSQNVEKKIEEERGLNPGPQVNKLRPYQCNAPTNLLVSSIYVFIHMYTVLIRRKKGGHGTKRIRTRDTWIRASHPTAAPCLCLRWSGKLNLFTYGLNSLYIQTFKIFFYFQDMNYNKMGTYKIFFGIFQILFEIFVVQIVITSNK